MGGSRKAEWPRRRRSIVAAAGQSGIATILAGVLTISAHADEHPSVAVGPVKNADAMDERIGAKDVTPADADPAAARVRLGPTTGLLFESDHSRLAFHVHSWLRAQSDTRVGDETDAEASVPVARFILEGSLLDDKLHFFVQPELAGTRDDELLDLFAEWHFDERLRIRAGQFRTPFSRTFITALASQQLTERGLVVDRFNIGRDTGVMASGELVSGLFHYDLGIFNGAGINDLSGERDAPTVVARTELRLGDVVPYDQVPALVLDDPHGVTIAVGGAFGRKGIETRSPGLPPSTTTETLWNATSDLAWMHGPLSVHAEAFWRRADGSPRPTNAFGATAQAGLFVVPRRLELGGRGGWISSGGLSKEGASNVGPDVYSGELFLASYWQYGQTLLGHHLKTLLDYRYDSGDPSSGSSRDRHRVMLQTQLFF